MVCPIPQGDHNM